MPDLPAVLYVEDDYMSRLVMEVILIEQMHLSNVAIFKDSSNFAAQVAELTFQPDVVFLDIQLGPLDGFEMLKVLREQPSYASLPIVALTASVMNEDIIKLRKAGFNGVIPKPIDIDVFPDVITKLMAGEEYWRVINLPDQD
jgi:CheY-like chemotaxis protein